MQSIKIRSRVGQDGILHLEIPLELKNQEVEVMVSYQPIEAVIPTKTPEELGWPPGFFEQTYGSCQDDPIVIDYEGDFENREEIV